MVHEQSYLGTISGGGCGHGSALMVGTATTAATDEAPPRHAVACHYEAVHAAQLYRHRNTRAANYSQTVSPTSTPGLKMEVNQGSLDPSTWKIATSATSLQQNDHHSHNVPHHSPMKPPPTIKPLASDSSIIDIPDLSTLNLRPIDKAEGLVKCDLERVHSSFSAAKVGLFEVGRSVAFRLFVAGTDELILSAKRSGNEWYISSYAANQTNQNHCAILSWNVWRTEFHLHSRWCEGCEPGATPFNCTTPHHEREMLAAILYERNYKGDTPRQVTAVIPAVNGRGQRDVCCPVCKRRDLVSCFDSGDWGSITPFTSKAPKWNETKQRFEAGFTERIKVASIKNLILQKAGKAESLLQFGKFAKNRYALDFQFPLSPVQAFAIAISSFEASLICT